MAYIVKSQPTGVWGSPEETSISDYPFYTLAVLEPDRTRRKKPTGVVGNGTERFAHTTIIHNSYMNSWLRPRKVCYFSVHQACGPYVYPNDFDPGGELSIDYVNNLSNRARSSFRGQHVNLAMMMAEYRQTASLFATNVDRLVKAAAAIRRVTNVSQAAAGLLQKALKSNSVTPGQYKRRYNKISKQAAKAHLEIVYGVIPLMSDLSDALAELRKGPNAAFERISAKETKRVKLTGSGIYQNNFSDCPDKNVYLERTVTKYVTLYAEAVITNGSLLATLGNYGLTNPAALAWELIPFSFVVDWHINVGDVLASLDNLAYFSGATYQVVTKVLNQASFRAYGGLATYYHKSYYRSAPSDLSVISTFEYKPSISKQHCLNGTALLRSLIR